MWFPTLVIAAAATLAAFAAARRRRFRRREIRLILADVKDFARIAADPALAKGLAFTGPHRCDEDRAHDTMFTARHGHRRLSFVLDASRRRLRWWVLSELFAPTGERSARFEATFVEAAIPSAAIRDLLKAARGEPVIDAPTGAETSPPVPEAHVDPFEPVASDDPTPTAQA